VLYRQFIHGVGEIGVLFNRFQNLTQEYGLHDSDGLELGLPPAATQMILGEILEIYPNMDQNPQFLQLQERVERSLSQ
jgi:hypothetical protein